jgi:hypothetical protein
MLKRCERSPYYADRGIKVCQEWQQFAQFFADMGHPPDDSYTIERIDNEGDYEPSNCRWATRIEQGANKRNNCILEIRGEKKTAAEWSRQTGVPSYLIRDRIKRNWTAENAVYTKPRLLKKSHS